MVCYALIKMNEAVPPAQIWKDLAVHHSQLGSIHEAILLVSLPSVAISGLAWLEASHTGSYPRGICTSQK